ncbi:outer membrane protein transport protein [Halomonas denitrificans]|nr:outer membrane protein transport protein [Halomonas denitrificans]
MIRRLSIASAALAAALAAAPASTLRAAPSGVLPGASFGVTWSLLGMELGPWEAYLAHELTPDLPNLHRGPRPDITWLQIDHNVVLPEFARPLLADSRNGLALFSTSLTNLSQMNFSAPASTGNGAFSFQRSMMLSGFSSRLSDRNRVSVSAVLASQQFSHSMLDTQVFESRFHDPLAPVRASGLYAQELERSQGAGLRLGFETDLAPRVRISAAYQSRINMDELASLRGVHGYSADLDIPPRMQMGVDLRATDRTVFTMAVSQVFYSDVGAFPSRALPARFNALLGDSTSPSFEWNDLTVYSFGLRWQHESDFEFRVDYHTRSQPTPTAPTLASALAGELAQQSILVGIGKGVGERVRLDLSASYAPPEFAFGGNVLGVVSDRLDQAVEVAARLNVSF